MSNAPKFSVYRHALIALAALLLTACASEDFRLTDAAISGNPDAMWEDGQRAVIAGEGLVDRGEKRLAAGREQVREGEARIADGNKRVLQAKQDYIAAVARTGDASTPQQVQNESKQLQAIGKRWEGAISDIRDGNKLVDRGNKSIDQGQSEIREGRMLMEQGSTLMRNSQRTRRGEKLLPEPGSGTR